MKQPFVKLGPNYKDKRGVIEMLLESQETHSFSKITSLPGTTRAQHWHKADSHFCMVSYGQIEYYERPVDSDKKPTKTIIKPGQMFYTAPRVQHEMFFPVKTEFLCLSTLSRKNADYENDTTRFDYSLKDLCNKTKR